MPEISRFYGILIKMYFSDHFPPHFHAIYGEHVALFSLDTLEMIEGDLPPRALRLVREWAEHYKADMKKMWDAQKMTKLPGLE
ncbi:MAG TPA: DUF4160 domain-containing protein [bacterium]|nr:DUF4160 domain-containing protein [bacterium]